MRKWTKSYFKEEKEQIVSWPTEQDYKEMNKKLWLNNMKISQPLKLLISEWVHSHIRALHIKYPNKEWLAICKTEQVEPWVFKVIDMIHPEQTASSGSVTATDKGMDWSVDYLIEQWEDLSQWNLILHSHHHMGVFWSWTDDKARLWYNDGRFMCWAVVTAYSWTPETGAISYKGCVNFYKPYNIEIDCEVIQPERDLYQECEEYLNLEDKYKEQVKENAEKNFEELLEQNAGHLTEISDNVDYSRIIEYLGIDITPDLLENYKFVSTKIPNPQVEEFMKWLEEQAIQKAEEETQMEEKEIPEELAEWFAWHDGRETQLVKAFETGEAPAWKSYVWKYYRESLFPQEEEKQKEKEIPQKVSVVDYDYNDGDEDTVYTKRWFPTAEMLKDELGVGSETLVMLDWFGRWQVWSTVSHSFELVEDWLDLIQYDAVNYDSGLI